MTIPHETKPPLKWPSQLIWIRHGQSAYNALKEDKDQLPGYLEFARQCKKELEQAQIPNWPSADLIAQADQIFPQIRLEMSDARTPLSDIGWQQAEKTGAGLRDHLDLPDIVYHSDYLRTQQTYEGICRGWPELKNVKKSIDSRIREQEHGLLTLFNDKWLYFAYNPQDALLYRKDGKFYFRFANGENKHDVLTRVWQFYSKLIRDHSGQKVLVIAHHITILAHRANQENWSAEQFLAADENERPSNCGVSTYEGDLAASPEKGGKLVLKEYNRVYY